jgi:hypothetical protein
LISCPTKENNTEEIQQMSSAHKASTCGACHTTKKHLAFISIRQSFTPQGLQHEREINTTKKQKLVHATPKISCARPKSAICLQTSSSRCEDGGGGGARSHTTRFEADPSAIAFPSEVG